MDEQEVWDTVIRGQAEGVRRLYEVGAYTPKETVAECDRLLKHEHGCPEDVRVKLAELRRRASAQLF